MQSTTPLQTTQSSLGRGWQPAASGPVTVLCCSASSTQRRRDLFFLEGNSSELTFGIFPLQQIELGTACGKLFRCSTMAVLDAGDSDILSEQAQ